MDYKTLTLDGDGDGDGYGSGYGDGYGSGYGDGDGYGDGSGYGYGDGDGDGYGYGYGDGDGDGYGHGKLHLDRKYAWEAYHYIREMDGKYILRSGKPITVGEHLREDNIRMCEIGLHASFTQEDAAKYAPNNSRLTRVKIWGDIIVDKDKLVATDRQLIAIL